MSQAGVGGESSGLRDALISGLSSVRRGAAFGSLRQLDLRSCNQPELLKMDDSQVGGDTATPGQGRKSQRVGGQANNGQRQQTVP